MTLVSVNSSSSSGSWNMSWGSTIEEVKIPKDTNKNIVKIFALTKVDNYSVSTICKGGEIYETQILLTNFDDEDRIGYYVKSTTNKKNALDQHMEAIWHVHHSCREGI